MIRNLLFRLLEPQIQGLVTKRLLQFSDAALARGQIGLPTRLITGDNMSDVLADIRAKHEWPERPASPALKDTE